ncbi:MAG TPA: hypothetical protein VJ765_08575 [Chitinophagaceae bacterium]|nr:hypothetical protein [Chitinophagaceae bacterium]
MYVNGLQDINEIEFRILKAPDRESYKNIRHECLTIYTEYFGDGYEEEANAHPFKSPMRLNLF